MYVHFLCGISGEPIVSRNRFLFQAFPGVWNFPTCGISTSGNPTCGYSTCGISTCGISTCGAPRIILIISQRSASLSVSRLKGAPRIILIINSIVWSLKSICLTTARGARNNIKNYVCNVVAGVYLSVGCQRGQE